MDGLILVSLQQAHIVKGGIGRFTIGYVKAYLKIYVHVTFHVKLAVSRVDI